MSLCKNYINYHNFGITLSLILINDQKIRNVLNSRKGKFYFNEDVVYVFGLCDKTIIFGSKVENSIRAQQ